MKEKKEKKQQEVKKEIDKSAVGTLAMSSAGRDKEKFFLIIDVLDADHVLIADGKYHRLAKPKKKKNKHLKKTTTKFSTVAEKLLTGKKVFDSEIYSAIYKTVGATENENKE